MNFNFNKTGQYKCKCEREFVKLQSFLAHKSHCCSKKRKYKGWSKGLTKETNVSIAKMSESLKGKKYPGRKLTEQQKLKISKALKLAHKEGRAWNIGKSRWNNKPSYPEKFFEKVVKNEFKDQEYQREFPVDIYAIDFAWPHKKKAIEIDGHQHERFQDYKDRDQKKDKILKKEGWDVLRIKWSQMFKDTKKWISIAKDFIDLS